MPLKHAHQLKREYSFVVSVETKPVIMLLLSTEKYKLNTSNLN